MRLRNCAMALLIALTGCAPALATHSRDRAPAPGIGETVLLVVGDITTPASAASRRDALNARFGDLQGFSVDSTDNYVLKGVLLQTSPDTTRISCAAGLEVFPAYVGDRFRTLECPSGATSVDVVRDITLRYLTRTAFLTYVPGGCGSVGQVPCQAARLRQLLGTTVKLVAGRSIIATAFRTKAGAEQFMQFARAAGATNLVVMQAFKAGGGAMGLGQEPAPDGSGPLSHALADQEGFQH